MLLPMYTYTRIASFTFEHKFAHTLAIIIYLDVCLKKETHRIILKLRSVPHIQNTAQFQHRSYCIGCSQTIVCCRFWVCCCVHVRLSQPTQQCVINLEKKCRYQLCDRIAKLESSTKVFVYCITKLPLSICNLLIILAFIYLYVFVVSGTEIFSGKSKKKCWLVGWFNHAKIINEYNKQHTHTHTTHIAILLSSEPIKEKEEVIVL